jgi:hypothetical protein
VLRLPRHEALVQVHVSRELDRLVLGHDTLGLYVVIAAPLAMVIALAQTTTG